MQKISAGIHTGRPNEPLRKIQPHPLPHMVARAIFGTISCSSRTRHTATNSCAAFHALPLLAREHARAQLHGIRRLDVVHHFCRFHKNPPSNKFLTAYRRQFVFTF